jgi:hypothetical protein
MLGTGSDRPQCLRDWRAIRGNQTPAGSPKRKDVLKRGYRHPFEHRGRLWWGRSPEGGKIAVR